MNEWNDKLVLFERIMKMFTSIKHSVIRYNSQIQDESMDECGSSHDIKLQHGRDQYSSILHPFFSKLRSFLKLWIHVIHLSAASIPRLPLHVVSAITRARAVDQAPAHFPAIYRYSCLKSDNFYLWIFPSICWTFLPSENNSARSNLQSRR